jgi:hypothetical protein
VPNFSNFSNLNKAYIHQCFSTFRRSNNPNHARRLFLASQQCFSFTTNQPTILSAAYFQPSEQTENQIDEKHCIILSVKEKFNSEFDHSQTNSNLTGFIKNSINNKIIYVIINIIILN